MGSALKAWNGRQGNPSYFVYVPRIGSKNTLSTSSNSQIISVVYRMVVRHDRKIKYVAYISRLQSNRLNQRAQMSFCEKNSLRLSTFLLKTFSTFTNSESLKFFSH